MDFLTYLIHRCIKYISCFPSVKVNILKPDFVILSQYGMPELSGVLILPLLKLSTQFRTGNIKQVVSILNIFMSSTFTRIFYSLRFEKREVVRKILDFEFLLKISLLTCGRNI